MTDHPIQMLKDEHRSIEKMLGVLARFCSQMENGQSLPGEALDEVLDFISVFADAGHHGKEEKNLFPLLEQKGMPRQGGPVGVMLSEHEEGRRLVRRIRALLQSSRTGGLSAVSQELVAAARHYIDLLHAHIEKEEKVLFPLATEILDEEDFRGLKESFTMVNQEMGTGEHDRYVRLASRMEQDSVA